MENLLEEIQSSDYNEFVIEYLKNDYLCILDVVSAGDSVYYFNDFNLNIHTDKINKYETLFFLQVLENCPILSVNLRKYTSTSHYGFPLQKLKKYSF
jgi:hypothetical protein